MRTKATELLGIRYPIDNVPTCAELIERIVRDCREQLRAAAEMVAA